MFRVWGLGFRYSGQDFTKQGLWSRVWNSVGVVGGALCLGLRVSVFASRFYTTEFRVKEFKTRLSAQGFREYGRELRVLECRV